MTQLTPSATRELSQPGLGLVRPQVGESRERALVQRRVRARLTGRALEPVRVGRFVLVECIGHGGMGVVYLAYDPELDRRVAVKLVHSVDDPGDAEAARQRLVRESKAAARLSHPNVVTVYDVGVHEDQVFLAMEFVAGPTLSGWLGQRRRGWRQVLAMFVEVGRGLAAAHDAGLVHRDFKPDNVLVGQDERPRIADFGLACSGAQGDPTQADSPGSGPAGVTPVVAGTPAYMAPEQFTGGEVGPAADQYGFFVALHEALTGCRPGRWSEVCKEHPGIPRALMEVVRRGLAEGPTARHAGMAEVLRKLERIQQRRRRRVLSGAAILLCGSGVAAGLQFAHATADQPCAPEAAELAHPWTAARRAAVRTALATTPGPSAELAIEPLIGAIDAHVQAWVRKRVEVCEATRVTGHQSDLAFALRTACLDRLAGRLDGFTAELARPSRGSPPSQVLDVSDVAAHLGALTSCDDVEHLSRLSNRLAQRSARRNQAQDDAWVQASMWLERGLLRQRLGRADAREAAQMAAQLGAEHHLAGVHSRALALLADLELDAGRSGEAQALRRQAMDLAIADGDDVPAVNLMLDQADAALFVDDLRAAELHWAYYTAFAQRIDRQEARAMTARRATIIEARLALARGDAAGARQLLGPVVDAGGLSELDGRAALMALGTAQRSLGAVEDAGATWAELFDLVVGLRGVDHVDVAAVLNNLALVDLDLGQHERGMDRLARAEGILVRALGADHPSVAGIATNRGWAARQAGQLELAREYQLRALKLGTAAFGEDHPSLAYALDELGELDRLAGRWDEALARLGRAGEIRDQAYGPGHPEVATTLRIMARVFLDQGRSDQARAAAEAGLRALVEHPGDPLNSARLRWLLAQALPAEQGEQAEQLVAQVREQIAPLGARAAALQRELAHWPGRAPP